MALAGALCQTLLAATGFTSKNLRVLIAGLLGSAYAPGQMAYDLLDTNVHWLTTKDRQGGGGPGLSRARHSQVGSDRADIDFPGGASSAATSRSRFGCRGPVLSLTGCRARPRRRRFGRSRSETIADQDDAHPHIETTDEPGAEAKGGLAMYQGQRS